MTIKYTYPGFGVRRRKHKKTRGQKHLLAIIPKAPFWRNFFRDKNNSSSPTSTIPFTKIRDVTERKLQNYWQALNFTWGKKN